MDDSGKLSRSEEYSVYGGLLFSSKEERQKFCNQYRSLLKDIKCDYCKETKTACSKTCPEIKSFLISNAQRRRIVNLCKQYKTFSLIINNTQVYSHIMENKASKGRYIDYTQKITFKTIIRKLISKGLINPALPLKISINIDQQATKSNGYYNLRDGLYEEFYHGISNYNYGFTYPPILKAEPQITVDYIDSKKSVAIQAADIIAGTTRRIMYYAEDEITKRKRLDKLNWVICTFPK